MDRLFIGILIILQQVLVFLQNKYSNVQVGQTWMSGIPIGLSMVNIVMILYAIFCFYETIRTGGQR